MTGISARIFLFGTLRGRLILSVAFVHAVLMTMFIADLTVRQRSMILENQSDNAVAMANLLALSSAGWLASHDLSGMQELVDARLLYRDTIFAILAERNGLILAHTDKSRRGMYLSDLPGNPEQTILSKSAELVDVAAPVMLGKTQVGWARVGIGQKKSSETLSLITIMGVIYALAAVAIGSLIAWTMGSRITKRLYAVQEVMARVKSGDYAARSNVPGNDEAASIAYEFNSLLDTLQASEANYKRLLDTVQEGIWVVDSEAVTTFVNPRMEKILGYAAGEMLGKSLFLFMDEKGRALALQLIHQRMQGIRGEHDLGLIRKDGKYIFARFEAAPIINESGEYLGTIAAVTNITGRRLADEALQRSRDQFGLVLDSLDSLVYVADMNTYKLLFMNKYGRDIWGNDSVGRICWETLQSGQTGPCSFCTNQKLLLPDGEPAPLFVWESQNTVNRHWYECRDQAIRWHDGRLVRMEIATDITDRKDAAEQIRKSNEVMERIFAMTTICIAYMDRNFTFMKVNEMYAAADNKTPDYFLGKNHFVLYPNAENEKIFRHVVETGEQHIAIAKPFEYAGQPERGISHWDWSLTPVKDSHGEVEAVILSLANVTERIKAQENLAALNAELERRVSERTAELEAKNAELIRMNKAFVGRELKMVQLKERISSLEKENRIKDNGS